jgi:FKBP-type peptidyl-prolyl cis-trans isomerase FklB
MKKVLLCMLVLTTVLSVTAQKTPTTAPVKVAAPIIKSLLDSFSYMAGYNVANNMKQQGITDVNATLFKKGFEDYFKNEKPLLTPEIGNQSLQRQLDVFNKAKAAADKIKADAENAKGVAFLEANKKRKEVITLPDGLQYEIIKQGDSITHKPTVVDTVVVNYIGALIDGKEFDNSYKRGQPAVFAVGRVIKGWTEILQLMPVGAHWKVYIPTELAYGDNPPPGSGISPGVPLIFDILLEGIKPVKVADKQ